MPMIKPSDFYLHLAELQKLDILYGCQDSTVLTEFWRRFAVIEPMNSIIDSFHAGILPPERTIPMVIHGDEGRARKHLPIMIVNSHGLIGNGCKAFEEWHKQSPMLKEASMAVNLKGSSMATRFLAFAMPKQAYGKDSEYLHKMFDELVADFVSLQNIGILVAGQRWHPVVIGMVGDLQFFAKIGRLTRSFSHVSKRTGQRALNGICHLCLAGQANYAFEDCSDDPGWYATLGAESPWTEAPTFVRRLHTDTANPAGFMKLDIFHCLHMGAGKIFLASSVAEWLPFVPGQLGFNNLIP